MKTEQSKQRVKTAKRNPDSVRLGARERKLLAELRQMILAARQTFAGRAEIFSRRKKP